MILEADEMHTYKTQGEGGFGVNCQISNQERMVTNFCHMLPHEIVWPHEFLSHEIVLNFYLREIIILIIISAPNENSQKASNNDPDWVSNGKQTARTRRAGKLYKARPRLSGWLVNRTILKNSAVSKPNC